MAKQPRSDIRARACEECGTSVGSPLAVTAEDGSRTQPRADSVLSRLSEASLLTAVLSAVSPVGGFASDSGPL